MYFVNTLGGCPQTDWDQNLYSWIGHIDRLALLAVDHLSANQFLLRKCLQEELGGKLPQTNSMQKLRLVSS